jgi:hypothetical protein
VAALLEAESSKMPFGVVVAVEPGEKITARCEFAPDHRQ